MKKVLIGSFLFVGLYNLFFFPTVIGLGLGFLFFFWHSYLFFIQYKKALYLPWAMTLSVLAIFFAFAISWRANEIIQAINLLLTMFFSVCAGYFYKKEKEFSWGMFAFLLAPLAAFGEGIVSTFQFFNQNSVTTHTQQNKAMYSAVFRGAIIAVPILFVLYSLLSGADPIFAKLFHLSFTVSGQTVLSLFIFVIAFFWGITRVKDRFVIKHTLGEEKEETETIAIESLVVTLSAAVLFALFLYIQIQYLFIHVPETQLQELGINIKTYSEYVKQGFFQLLVASAIATSIVGYGLKSIHTITHRRKLYLQAGMVLLTLETEFLLVSAAKRLYLYANYHGLTTSRVFGMIFLLWLAAVLFLILYGTVKHLKKMYFFLVFFALTVFACISITLVPIDELVAVVYPPTVNKEVDYSYLTDLSPDAAAAWPGIIKHAQTEWKSLSNVYIPSDDQQRKVSNLRFSLLQLRDTAFYLDRKYTKNPKEYIPFYSEKTDGDVKELMRWKTSHLSKTWQAFNLGEYNAYLLMKENKELFQQIQPLRDAIHDRDTEWTSLKDAEYRRTHPTQ